MVIKCTRWDEKWKYSDFLSIDILTHQVIIQFNIKYSVQPQNSEVLKSHVKFAQQWKTDAGASCSLQIHFNAFKNVLKDLTI